MSVEISLPVLNEAATLRAQVEKMVSFVEAGPALLRDVRFIIADNGSDDETAEIGSELASQYDRVEFVSVTGRGVGRALKGTWGASKADIIGYMDLDLATDLRHLPDAIELLVDGKADFVTGSRLLPDSKVVNRSATRALTSRVFNGLVKTYFGTRFSDGMCGFKFLKRACYPQLSEMGADSDNWFFCTEILICAEKAGLRVADMPVEWTDDANSKAKIIPLALKYLSSMRKLKKQLARERHQEAS